MNPLFLDIHALPESVTNDALELMFKAINDDGDGIWKPHESPLLRRLVELFTRRGLDRLDHVKQQIIAWESGANYKDATKPIPRPGMMERWGKDELSLVRIYLEALYPGDWTLEDHMLALEYVIQRYLPQDEMRTEAEWLATKSSMMGKVQANMEQQATLQQADTILSALPSTVAAATAQFSLNQAQRIALEYGAARCAENVRALTESVRHQMRGLIMQHTEEVMMGSGQGGLETKLFDAFATLNRDWRRIAITEATENLCQGFVASQELGTKIKRVEQYQNACSFCRSIDGKVVTVVAPDHPQKDGDTMVWVGKTNIGRSSSPRKRVGNLLVLRTPEERLWIASGAQHVHCRGRWVKEYSAGESEDKEFRKFLLKLLS